MKGNLVCLEAQVSSQYVRPDSIKLASGWEKFWYYIYVIDDRGADCQNVTTIIFCIIKAYIMNLAIMRTFSF